MITPEQAKDIRARYDALSAWVDTIRDKKTGWASYRPEDKPSHVPNVSNEERSALEVFEFVTNPPEKYFLYIRESGKCDCPKEAIGATTHAHTCATNYPLATTWTGEKLGNVIFGREYRVPAFGGFPSKRVPVTIRAINGKTYYGTYYKSSGNYARVKIQKEKK